MSDRPCNYCDFRSIKRRYEGKGMVVTTCPEHGWVTAYAHPTEIDIGVLTEEERKPYFKASFMELPDHCCC